FEVNPTELVTNSLSLILLLSGMSLRFSSRQLGWCTFMLRFLYFGMLLVLLGCAHQSGDQGSADAAFTKLADEYIAGHFAWRPKDGTQAGLHEYDGRITDLSWSSIQGELRRLKDFERRLTSLPSAKLSPGGREDFRILLATVQKEIFLF